jgi:hypothetical protein
MTIHKTARRFKYAGLVAMIEQQVPQVMSYQGYGFSSSFCGLCSTIG